MRADRKEIERAIREFIENPHGKTLELDVGWVAQAGWIFPKHLTDGEGLFLCGTRYVHEENTDGNLMGIALVGRNESNVATHSVKFMFSGDAQFVLCKKCLAWLRKQMRPLESKSDTSAD